MPTAGPSDSSAQPGSGCADAAGHWSADDGNGGADAGPVVSTKGRLRFGVSIGNAKVKSYAATLDGAPLASLGDLSTGSAPAFSAGTADEGLAVEPGLHRLRVTLTASLSSCRGPVGVSTCDPIFVDGTLTHQLDLTVRAGVEQTAVALFRVFDDHLGHDRIHGRVSHFDTTPTTTGSLAGVARVQIIREPSLDFFEGSDAITFGADPAVTDLPPDDDAVILVPPNASGKLSVVMNGFFAQKQSAVLPAVPAGQVLPVIVWSTPTADSLNITIPSEHAGAGKNLAP